MVGRFGLVVADDPICHMRDWQHLHGGVQAGGDIHFEDGRAVHVGVGFDGADEVEDAGWWN